MSLADEMLNNISDGDMQIQTAEPETEGHIVIDNNRNVIVPKELTRIAVQFDHNIETVTFDCPRYWDGNDMSVMKIYINYKRPDDVPGCYLADNVVVDENDPTIMHFNWKIEKHVTMVSGNLTFLVCIKKTDSEGNEEQHWNSKLNTEIFILEGLECDEEIFEAYPSIFDKLVLDAVNQSHADAEEMVANHTHNYAGSPEAGGAANSALKLENPININGMPFDGTADIEIPTGNDEPVHSIYQPRNVMNYYVEIAQIDIVEYQNYYPITIIFRDVSEGMVLHTICKILFCKKSETAEPYLYGFYKSDDSLYGDNIIIGKTSDATKWRLYIRCNHHELNRDVILCDFPNDAVSIIWKNELLGKTLDLTELTVTSPKPLTLTVNINGSSNSSETSEKSRSLTNTTGISWGTNGSEKLYFELCDFTVSAGFIMNKYILTDYINPQHNAEIYVYAYRDSFTNSWVVPPTLIVNPIGPYRPDYFIMNDEGTNHFSVWLYCGDATGVYLKWYKVTSNADFSGSVSDSTLTKSDPPSHGTKVDAKYAYDNYIKAAGNQGPYQATSTSNSIDINITDADKYASVLVNMNIHSNNNNSLAYHQTTLPAQLLINNNSVYYENANFVFANGSIVPTQVLYTLNKTTNITSQDVYTLTITITSGTGVISFAKAITM